MGRPRYETKKDLERERYIADTLRAAWSVEMCKLPDHQHIDFALVDASGKITCLVEVKWRSFEWGQYPDVMLSASKVLKAREFFEVFAVPALFVVCDRNNDIRYCRIESRTDTLWWGGRTAKPRDSQDAEAIIRIPVGEFKRL